MKAESSIFYHKLLVASEREISIVIQPQNIVNETPRGVLPYISYTGMCRWKEYGFQAICSGIGSSK